jgi:hypothetical protein
MQLERELSKLRWDDLDAGESIVIERVRREVWHRRRPYAAANALANERSITGRHEPS